MNHAVHFPSDCCVVGEGPVSKANGIETQNIYVRGIRTREELGCLGSVSYLPKDNGEVETVVTVTTGLPSEDFIG